MASIEGAPAVAGINPQRPQPETDVKAGIIAALCTYGIWGVLPLYFKLVQHVEPVALLANRIVFSLLVVGLFVAIREQIGEIFVALRNRRVLTMMTISSVLIAVNWLVFIWAVYDERVLEVSFGYFITPLVNVAIGMMLLGERMTRLQWVAIAVAAAAIAIQAAGLGAIPWVSLALALSFALYGYVRKTVRVASAPGLMIETVILTVPSALYIVYVLLTTQPDLYVDPLTNFYLFLAGPFTAVPLVLFTFAARQLKLSTIGMFQYMAPSMQFIMAVTLFGEHISVPMAISFGMIWTSVVIFTLDAWRRRARAA